MQQINPTFSFEGTLGEQPLGGQSLGIAGRDEPVGGKRIEEVNMQKSKLDATCEGHHVQWRNVKSKGHKLKYTTIHRRPVNSNVLHTLGHLLTKLKGLRSLELQILPDVR